MDEKERGRSRSRDSKKPEKITDSESSSSSTESTSDDETTLVPVTDEKPNKEIFHNYSNSEFLQELANLLANSISTVKKLDFFASSIGGGNADFSRLKKFKNLEKLTLAQNNLRDEDLEGLAKTAVSIPTLTSLDISDNPSTNAGLIGFAKYLPQLNLEELFIRDSKVKDQKFTAAGVCALAEKINKNLKKLVIIGNDIGPEGIKAFVKSLLGANTNLKILILDNTNIGAGTPHLAELLNIKSLTKISISDNNIDDEGAEKLLIALSAKMKTMPQTSFELVFSANEKITQNLVKKWRLFFLEPFKVVFPNPPPAASIPKLAIEKKHHKNKDHSAVIFDFWPPDTSSSSTSSPSTTPFASPTTPLTSAASAPPPSTTSSSLAPTPGTTTPSSPTSPLPSSTTPSGEGESEDSVYDF